MKNIYIAAPLFNEMELKRNEHIAQIIEKIGFSTYLPQRDAGIACELIESSNVLQEEIRKRIFEKDCVAVKNSDIILFLIDGRTPDEGSCIELGIGYALGKICIGYKTDSRAMDKNGNNNIMLDGCLNWHIFSDEEELCNALKKIK